MLGWVKCHNHRNMKMNVKDDGNVPVAPVDFAALRQMMLDERRKLPKRISQVAAYSLDNPDEIAFGTAASIAASAGVQPSTLIRFARFFGFDGFTSLQSLFRERLRDRNLSYESRCRRAHNRRSQGVHGSVCKIHKYIGDLH